MRRPFSYTTLICGTCGRLFQGANVVHDWHLWGHKVADLWREHRGVGVRAWLVLWCVLLVGFILVTLPIYLLVLLAAQFAPR